MSDPNQFPGAPAYNPMHGMGGGEPGKIRSSGMCVLLFFVNVLLTRRRGRRVGNDPWLADTLEWYTTSPPPPWRRLQTWWTAT